MKKLSNNEVKRLLPFTIQEATITNLNKTIKTKGIRVSMYQNENTTSQQFYKPISKILQF
ncbi:hypothetical protein [Cellulophaga baltica]|uniref:Uncharacterized protein n=1 Tax=Cellulophaga baltica TaxID=76594 RepID=A0A1G7JPC5_9FLAO|nr:hypothetical protein [Cellulophaga baltica]SDF26329.1 hypothetical protein SAMN04487992_11012 [Cellulophaga baltica]